MERLTDRAVVTLQLLAAALILWAGMRLAPVLVPRHRLVVPLQYVPAERAPQALPLPRGRAPVVFRIV